MWNLRWRPRNGWDGRLIAKILIMTIHVNLVLNPSETWRKQHKFTWIVVIKTFAINLPSQPFLGCHVGFHIFFHDGLFGGRTLLLQLGCFWIRFHFFLYAAKPAYYHLWLLLLVFFFSLCRQIFAVLHMCIMHKFYLKFIFCTVYVNDCRLI